MFKKKLIIVLLGFVLVISTFLSGQAKGQHEQKPSQFSPFKKEAGNKKKVILKIRNRSRFISVKGDKVHFSPHSGVKRSSYKVYIFALKEFKAKLGNPQKFKSKRVEVEIVKQRSNNYKSSDPRESSPDGGIRTTYYDVKIVSIIGGKRAGGIKGRKRITTLRVNNRKRYITVKGNEVYYNPYAGVRRSKYKVYIFALKEFKDKIGNPQKFKNKKVKVEIVRKRAKNYKSSNPHESRPDGGIRTIYFNAKILSIVSK